MTELDKTNKAIIDLDAQASPAILAGILDIPVSMVDRKSTRLNSSHIPLSRMPSSA